MESTIKEFKTDVSTLFQLITELRIENKAMATRGLIFQTVLLIVLQAGLAYWLKK